MANKQYLKDKNLLEAHNKFMRLAEAYLSVAQEGPDDDDQMNGPAGGPPPDGGMPPQGGGDPGMGGDPNGGMPPGGDPGMGGGDPSMGGDPNGGMPPGGDPNMGGGDPNMPPQGPEQGPGMPPDAPPMDEPPAPSQEEKDEEDNVLDVDDLTKAQEKLNDKFNGVGKNLLKMNDTVDKLMGAIEKVQSMVDSNNTEISNLKAELEKRNPTEVEKLNIRSLKSPFNVPPQAYWDEVSKDPNSNYEAYSDNSGHPQKEYVITNNDVDDVTDDIQKTFFLPDDDDEVTIKKIFGL